MFSTLIFEALFRRQKHDQKGLIPQLVVLPLVYRQKGRYRSFDSSLDNEPIISSVERKESLKELKPITLTWKNINVYVPIKRKPQIQPIQLLRKNDGNAKEESNMSREMKYNFLDYKHLLKEVNGVVEPGTLLAVMGSSGAGKTTLMNALTFRNKENLIITGEIKLNGIQVERSMSDVACYVQQDNLFMPTITVKEQLWFHSQLRMDKCTSRETRNKRVEEVIMEMGLHKCSNVMVGSPGLSKGISGGEMKRLAFAAELLTNPPLMFLDEPMSGLDSYMAKMIMIILREMASNGRSIICTIHQPSSEMFQMFDKLLLVSEGRVAFLGPASEASEFFESCGHPMPLNYNPSEHFVKVLAVEPGTEEISKQRIEHVCDRFLHSKYSEIIQKQIETANSVQDQSLVSQMDTVKYKASCLTQFYVMMWRCATKNLREPVVFWIKLIQIMISALMFGTLFWKQKHDQKGVASINGVLFYMQLQFSFVLAINVVQDIPDELPIFFKEHFDGMYRADVYFISKTLVEIPQLVVLPLVYSLICYWMIGLRSGAEAFFMMYACLLMACLAASACGYVVCTIVESRKAASLVTTLILTMIITVGGYVIHPNSVPFYFNWLKSISWVAYINEIMLVNQWFGVDDIECDQRIAGSNNSTTSTSNCFRNGNEIINFYGYSKDNIVHNFLMILVVIVCFRLVAFICLLVKSRGSYKMEKSRKSL